MPGSIHLAVLDVSDVTEAAGGGVSVKASLGKKQFMTEVAPLTAGKAGPWEDEEHAFSVLSLTDNVILSLLDANGGLLGSAQVTTPSIVEKGFRDETLAMKDLKGQTQGHVHVKLSFVLSDEERKKIEAMRAKSLAKKGAAADTSSAPAAAPPSDNVASPSINGRRPSASRFSFEKAIGGDEGPGSEETAAVVAAVGAEVDAQVARASTAARQATAEVAKQAEQVAATSNGPTAGSADKLARKATEVSEKAAGVAAAAAEGATDLGKAANGTEKANGAEKASGAEKVAAADQEQMLLRRPSVKDRVAALESPAAPVREGSLKKSREEGDAAVGNGSGGAAEGGGEGPGDEAHLAEEDWAIAQEVEASLRRAEERKREEDRKKVGKEAEEARRYEAEYREQRQRVEEYRRKEEEKKKEQERQRAAKAAAAARKAEEARLEEARRTEAAEHADDDSAEGATKTGWHQVAGTVAFAVALFFLWPRDSRKGAASRKRVRAHGGQYVVQKGDSLETIVGRMCYNPDSDFYKLNPGVCDRNTIYPGQVLRVPEYM